MMGLIVHLRWEPAQAVCMKKPLNYVTDFHSRWEHALVMFVWRGLGFSMM